MSGSGIHAVLTSLLLALPATASAEPLPGPERERMRALVIQLGEAAEEGYRECRLGGETNADRRRLQLRRLGIQARVLRSSLAEERPVEEIRPIVGTVLSLARDLAEEATEGYAGARFARSTRVVHATAEELRATLEGPRTGPSRYAEHEAKPYRY